MSRHADLSQDPVLGESLDQYLERLVASVADGEGGSPKIEMRCHPSTVPDVRLIFESREWLNSPGGQAAVKALSSSPAVESAQVKKATVSLRLKEEFLAGLGERLGEGMASQASGLLAGKRYVIQFLDPNSTKALHLGHLYDAVLGNAIAACLEAAGARVIRNCFPADVSRNVCEAIAGHLQSYPGQDPASAGMKSDHFVGKCYRAYTNRYYERCSAQDSNDPAAREIGVLGDLADTLCRGWLGGDARVRGLWRQIRDWAVAGQMETLERLGVCYDCIQYGSDTEEGVAQLVEEGLRRGILTREEDGAVVYKTGRTEYAALVLLRADGFHTEHARQLAQIRGVEPLLDELESYIPQMGAEWEPAFAAYEWLLRAYGPSPYFDRIAKVSHSMVTVEGSNMKSSFGEVILIDDFLDSLIATPQVVQLADSTGGLVTPSTIAEILVKGFFLSRNSRKPIGFSWDLFLNENVNVGWRIARAWCVATSGNDAGGALTETQAGIWRLLVVQGQCYRRILAYAASNLDVSPLAGYLADLSEYYLEAPPCRPTTVVARILLTEVMKSLGICAGGHGYQLRGGEARYHGAPATPPLAELIRD